MDKLKDLCEHKFPYKWNLCDINLTKSKGKVFSCFACGGGSSMGYKMAGFDVIGCNEIDPRMNCLYIQNHHPKYNYLMDIRELKELAKEHKLPEELYNLDILDGSPPCSTFSTAGDREKSWGIEKEFREGQSKQVLDTLFFEFIELASYLRPKVIIAENVRGILIGKAKAYTSKIHEELDKVGYYVQHFLCDGQVMGIPQRRERAFFLAIRKDLCTGIPSSGDLLEYVPFIDMSFNEPKIPYGECADDDGYAYRGKCCDLWEAREYGDTMLADANIRLYGKRSRYNQLLAYKDRPVPTLTSHKDCIFPFHKRRYLSDQEICCISSFPQDYDFGTESKHYVCGMSVPPVMMAQVADRVYEYWLSKI